MPITEQKVCLEHGGSATSLRYGGPQGCWRGVAGGGGCRKGGCSTSHCGAVLPVCVLNESDQPVTLYAGAVVATMTPIDPPVGIDDIENAVASEVDGQKQQTQSSHLVR